ncbi:hypothetical protein [Celeribacter halophilus]
MNAAPTVSEALHPVYWIAAGLAFAGLVMALFLREIPLSTRSAPARDEAT